MVSEKLILEMTRSLLANFKKMVGDLTSLKSELSSMKEKFQTVKQMIKEQEEDTFQKSPVQVRSMNLSRFETLTPSQCSVFKIPRFCYEKKRKPRIKSKVRNKSTTNKAPTEKKRRTRKRPFQVALTIDKEKKNKKLVEGTSDCYRGRFWLGNNHRLPPPPPLPLPPPLPPPPQLSLPPLLSPLPHNRHLLHRSSSSMVRRLFLFLGTTLCMFKGKPRFNSSYGASYAPVKLAFILFS